MLMIPEGRVDPIGERNLTQSVGVDLARANPIFIHGILPRSGTNFLCDLLLLHPDCSRAREPVREDLFLDHSDHLVAFAEAMRAAWDPRWGTFGSDLPDRLCAGIGEGLVSFLWADRSRRLVTKSPSVRHLARFFAFYPWARLLILVRDGRSVVQSGMATFAWWDFDLACRMWSEAADTIRRFQHAESARADRWRLVRYEDLLDDMERQLRGIFEFLALDPAVYDFKAARDLPVRGSSAFGREGREVHWEVVAKDESFAPKERWRSWSTEQLERFDWLAGAQLRRMGYTTQASKRSISHSIKHTLRDWRWRAARSARLAIYRSRVRLGTASLPLRVRLGLRRAS
jgi:protein-tyrosine sulfotransferase